MTLANGGAAKSVAGEAGNHAHAVREEAARAILGNHFRLLKDVCTPRKFLNVDDLPLTQPELERVPAKHAPYAPPMPRDAQPRPTDDCHAASARLASTSQLSLRRRPF